MTIDEEEAREAIRTLMDLKEYWKTDHLAEQMIHNFTPNELIDFIIAFLVRSRGVSEAVSKITKEDLTKHEKTMEMDRDDTRVYRSLSWRNAVAPPPRWEIPSYFFTLPGASIQTGGGQSEED